MGILCKLSRRSAVFCFRMVELVVVLGDNQSKVGILLSYSVYQEFGMITLGMLHLDSR